MIDWAHDHYKRSSRKVYRLLRHPRRRRRSRFQNWLAERVFDRELWRPTRDTVAKGLAAGLFLAMIPIPAQMAAGVAVASTKRWNIPATVIGVWLTNPLTLWIYYFPYRLGMAIFSAVGINVAGGRDVISNINNADTLLSFSNLSDAFTTAQAWLVGCVITGSVVAAIGYALIYFLWDVFSHVRVPAVIKRVPGRSVTATPPSPAQL
ncbi:MAG: DUF2062 domain-containing protein [Verrucomicrobia bacterium]|nr:DUF2062 domain-containing protein [Verrucomicrobiota bacterium]